MRSIASPLTAVLLLTSPGAFAQERGGSHPAVETELEAVAKQGAAAVERVWTREKLLQAFYDWLTPHGQWEEHPRWGWIWFHRDDRYRPFTDGRWKGSERGAQYVADTDYAWAVYHYGRWIYFVGRGWAWVPGFEWAESSVRFDQYQKYLASTGAEPEEPVVIHQPHTVGIAIGWESSVSWPQPVTTRPPGGSHVIAPPPQRPPPPVHRPAPARGSTMVRPAPAAAPHRSAPVKPGHQAVPATPAGKRGAAASGWHPFNPRH